MSVWVYYRNGKKSDPPLYWAVHQGDSHMAQLLLSIGADPNIAREDSAGPLVAAIEGGHRSIAKMLLSVGARWNTPVKNHKTLKEFAASQGLDDVVSMMKS